MRRSSHCTASDRAVALTLYTLAGCADVGGAHSTGGLASSSTTSTSDDSTSSGSTTTGTPTTSSASQGTMASSATGSETSGSSSTADTTTVDTDTSGTSSEPIVCNNDGVKDDGEECDEGDKNEDGKYNGCNTDCTYGPHCGDGMKTHSEPCDRMDPECLITCTDPEDPRTCVCGLCGDGTKQDNEACDDMNDDDYDGCPSSCQADHYLAFLTTAEQSGTALGGLVGADKICMEDAKKPGLNGSYMAWLSDSKTDAKVRLSEFLNANKSIRVRNGGVVAKDLEDLVIAKEKNYLTSAINYPASGGIPEIMPVDVWTGTKADGTHAENTCNDWTGNDNGAKGAYGDAYTLTLDGGWTHTAGDGDCTKLKRLYCIQVGF